MGPIPHWEGRSIHGMAPRGRRSERIAKEDRRMPAYISLASSTDQGVKNIKENAARLDAAKSASKAMGAELKDFYLVLGQ